MGARGRSKSGWGGGLVRPPSGLVNQIWGGGGRVRGRCEKKGVCKMKMQGEGGIFKKRWRSLKGAITALQKKARIERGRDISIQEGAGG